MLGDGTFGSFGIEILWSANLLNDGPEGIEFGRVKTSVNTANIAMEASRAAIFRGGIAGTLRPNRRRWIGIVGDEVKLRGHE